MIVNITEQAKVAFDEMFQRNSGDLTFDRYIRVYIQRISWRGPVFNVAQDEPTPKDEIFVVDGKYNVIMDKDLAKQFSVVNIYYKSMLSYSDFYVSTDLDWKDEYHYRDWGKPW